MRIARAAALAVSLLLVASCKPQVPGEAASSSSAKTPGQPGGLTPHVATGPLSDKEAGIVQPKHAKTTGCSVEDQLTGLCGTQPQAAPRGSSFWRSFDSPVHHHASARSR